MNIGFLIYLGFVEFSEFISLARTVHKMFSLFYCFFWLILFGIYVLRHFLLIVTIFNKAIPIFYITLFPLFYPFPLSHSIHHLIQPFHLRLITLYILKSIPLTLSHSSTQYIYCLTRLTLIVQMTIVRLITLECRNYGTSFSQFQKLLESLNFL